MHPRGMRAASAGDARFEEYVAARGQALLRFAYVLTTDAYTAEDLVQSALADAFRHWRRVSRADHPDAYVRRMIVNKYLGWRRRGWFTEVPTDRTADAAPAVADHSARPLRCEWPSPAPRGRSVIERHAQD
jgi:DNA-directed RNA polymerase specialized sigma24 family protein